MQSKGIGRSDKLQKINPYRLALSLMLSRARWDTHPASWVSRRRLRGWLNSHAGEKAVILCNGPSLNHVDFDLLKQTQVFTFGLNKINLLFPRTPFRPSVIVAVNALVIEQNADFFNSTEIPLFLDSKAKRHIMFRRNIHLLHSASVSACFAEDCSSSICQGYTVTYVAMQLAFHMGFTNVALVGCDHSFATKGPANAAVASGQTDPDHFDPAYFSKGVKWHLPDLTRSELHYAIAGEVFEKHGRKIVNCTEGGKLEIFERMSLSDFVRS